MIDVEAHAARCRLANIAIMCYIFQLPRNGVNVFGAVLRVSSRLENDTIYICEYAVRYGPVDGREAIYVKDKWFVGTVRYRSARRQELVKHSKKRCGCSFFSGLFTVPVNSRGSGRVGSDPSRPDLTRPDPARDMWTLLARLDPTPDPARDIGTPPDPPRLDPLIFQNLQTRHTGRVTTRERFYFVAAPKNIDLPIMFSGGRHTLNPTAIYQLIEVTSRHIPYYPLSTPRPCVVPPPPLGAGER